MSKTNTHDWNSSNILDDVDFQEHEARQFRDLLYGKSAIPDESALSLLNVGQILKGRIVEITKDYVVVDVGLKSEGLIPVSEFFDTNEILLGGETEVHLDAQEGEDGQIVLSKEKAYKFRQWEHIVNNCKEGSIGKGKVMRKGKGGQMVREIGRWARPGIEELVGHTIFLQLQVKASPKWRRNETMLERLGL